MVSVPPPPDTSVRPTYVGEEAVECIYSPQRQYRVIISRDRAGRYRVRRERWNTSDWQVANIAFWYGDDSMVTITDTVERASSLAAERLSEISET